MIALRGVLSSWETALKSELRSFSVSAVTADEDRVVVRLADDAEIAADALLVAVGRGANVTDLKSRLDVANYLSPHSDLVALMVLAVANITARASGVRRDLRKDEPILAWADNWDGEGAEAPKFDVVVCQTGDCFDRFMVRFYEMRESVKILKQALEQHNASEKENVDLRALLHRCVLQY